MKTNIGAMFRDLFSNVTWHKSRTPYSTLYYVVESADWSIKWDGVYITKELNRQGLLRAQTSTSHKGIRNQIIHFGSRGLFLPSTWAKIDPSDKVVFSWFHGTEEDRNPDNLMMIRALPEASKKADVVHTSCTISKQNLVGWGVPEEKIAVVPLGVDSNIFQPFSEASKDAARKEMGLPREKTVIGSFQKDGVGWREGLEPKWVKGPDIFIKVIRELRRNYDIIVLLTGPARGYVKRQLDTIGVPYKHFLLDNYLEIPKYYNVLDLYLITSRAEGGPKAILEAMATGVPVVSTRVGMAPDIMEEGRNGLLAEIGDVKTLVEKVVRIIEDRNMANRLVSSASNKIRDYSWEKIARQYYETIYQRLLNR